MTERLLTTAQVAHAVGVHPETVRRWVRDGSLACERVGPARLIRVRMSVLARFFPLDALNITQQHTTT